MNKNQRLKYLLEQVQRGAASPEEYNELQELINTDQSGEIIQQVHVFHAEHPDVSDNTQPYNFSYWNDAVKEILQVDKIKEMDEQEKEIAEIPPSQRVHFLRRNWWAAAAVIILLFGTGIYLVVNRTPQKDLAGAEPQKPNTNDIAPPTGSHSVLTLANGQKIVLDSIGNGTLAMQGATQVIKLANGQIAYDVIGPAANEIQYNTLAVPRGGKPMQLKLPDGSEVWLNSASSITYPTAFIGNERKVEITGETYFEVAKDASKKFLVSGNGITTEVLGTHFNINVYKDEANMRITLLEGSIKISNNSATNILKPGQQAQVGSTGAMKVTSNVDIDVVMAWKNGIFIMDKTDIGTIMRQIARWYDVEIQYQGSIPKGHISGDIPRDMNLSKVLKVMELSGVHYKIENKKVVILP